ncbi:cation:dicarboxylate symporter family transporter [Quadrisphaera sp. INWT6]|uniref:cation:dicarboxylate symporter family transporter n=1 Tax=Quadrisphaera sp. INWT6 TaxID=2596917 RepID=UPI0028164E40|nr:cation:dicarboxylase symporter family transporter [Quadrisphaera sp. INWT6]
MSSSAAAVPNGTTAPKKHKDKSHWLYIGVIVAVTAGIVLGLAAPETAKEMKPIGAAFIDLVKMMIGPVIFCTIVLGIGSIRKAATVGKVGGIALGYFLAMSTFALLIGLVVGNVIHPGDGLTISDSDAAAAAAAAEKAAAASSEAGGVIGFITSLIPTTLFSALVQEQVLQVLVIALVVGFALQTMGETGKPLLDLVGNLQKLVFKILAWVMWLAPIGAFGAIAGVVGETGVDALKALAILMGAFYLTCAVFVFVILGTILRVVTGLNIFSLLKYLGREFLLIVSTSSSETALPRLIAKMEHLGVARPVVGIVVPTGYSFNLDGTAIYLTMASIFIADAMGTPLSIPAQIGLLAFMILASKGAAGVTGAGLATLAGGLQAHAPALVPGVGFIVGIDRFMSEARAVTNFAGNAVATVLVGTWTKEIDKDRVRSVLAGDLPFDESSLAADGGHGAPTAGPNAPSERDGDLVLSDDRPLVGSAQR